MRAEPNGNDPEPRGEVGYGAGGPVKYRYTIVNEGVVEADNAAEAEAAAFQSCDQGFGVFAVEVEPLVREVGEE